jgi:hypothetical protein
MSDLIGQATCTIAQSAALSNAFYVGEKTIVAVQFPAAWTAADLTFQVSDDKGTTWTELRDDADVVMVSSPAAGGRYNLPAGHFVSSRWFKARSGTSGSPVNQAAARTLVFITRRLYPAR